VGFPGAGVGVELGGCAPPDNDAVGEDGHGVRAADREAVVLLDEEDGKSLLAQFRDDLADPVDDHRRESLRRLVHQQQRRVGQQRPGDREHLLLTSRQLAATVAPARAEVREQLIDPLQRPGRAAVGGFRIPRAERQVLLDR